MKENTNGRTIMYCNAKTLLANEEYPERYSLDRETDNREYLAVDDPVERFYIYKSGNVDTKSVYRSAVRYRKEHEAICSSISDCDSCDLAKDIYRLLWADAISDSENSAIDGQHGDTMTSLQHSLNLAFEQIETPEDRRRYFKGRRVSLAYQIELLSCEDNFLLRSRKVKGLHDFADRYHTIGNMIPVPPMFNSSRSNFGADDYWDVTLTQIKMWFDTKDVGAIVQLLHKKSACDEAVNLCVKWLTWFDSWQSFIEKNYLSDFVDEYFEPILFRPKTSEESEVFFEKCCSLIEARGRCLVQELRKRV